MPHKRHSGAIFREGGKSENPHEYSSLRAIGICKKWGTPPGSPKFRLSGCMPLGKQRLLPARALAGLLKVAELGPAQRDGCVVNERSGLEPDALLAGAIQHQVGAVPR